MAVGGIHRYKMDTQNATLPTRKMHKVFFTILFVSVVSLALYYCIQFHYLKLQVGQAVSATNVFQSAVINYHLRGTPAEILGDIVYVYGYYPPGTAYIPLSSPVGVLLEQDREKTITIMLIRLQKITHAEYGLDIDRWVHEFGNEQTRSSYASFKAERQALGLPLPLFCASPADIVPVQVMSAQPKTQVETPKAEEQ